MGLSPPDTRSTHLLLERVEALREITGPTDRKMTVNALNSGARIWLADFEDEG